MTTENKEPLYEFITKYSYKGKDYSDIVVATNTKDAEDKLKAKKETERILGYDPTNPIKV